MTTERMSYGERDLLGKMPRKEWRNHEHLHRARAATIRNLLAAGWIEQQAASNGSPQYRITESGLAAERRFDRGEMLVR